MKNAIKQIVIFGFSSILFGCATTEDGGAVEPAGEVSRRSNCIIQSSVRDYRVLDDSNLIVTAAGRRKYHVALGRRAHGLRSSWQIGFRTSTGQICPGFSDLIVDDGFGPDRFRIDSIVQLTPEDEEDLLIRFGKIEPEHTVTPAPNEVDSAEVEELD